MPVLAKLPSIYKHLSHTREYYTTPAKTNDPQLNLPQHHFPARVKLEFSSKPFPHLEAVVADTVPDKHLERLQKKSTQRREPYPHMGIVKIREGDIPDIHHPTYSKYEDQVNQAFELLELRHGNTREKANGAKYSSAARREKIALPLPSMLHKPIGKEEYVEKINSFNNRANQADSIPKTQPNQTSNLSFEYEVADQEVYFQHVLQPDFSDFEQNLMIQKPMIIYLQQKPVRNPLKYYR